MWRTRGSGSRAGVGMAVQLSVEDNNGSSIPAA
jgi:hypothetical protein